MRAGFTPAFRKRAHRPDPYVRTIVQAEVVAAGDIIQRKDHWLEADSVAGFRLLDDGRFTLAASTSTLLENTTSTVTDQDLNRTAPTVGLIEWAGSEPYTFRLNSITARLNPDVDSTGAVVDRWVLQLFRLSRVGSLIEGNEIEPICAPVEVDAGASAADVEFAFPSGFEPRPKLGGPPEVSPDATTGFGAHPVTIVHIWAIKEDGTAAGNVGWLMDGGNASLTSGSNFLTAYDLSSNTGSTWTFTAASKVPRMACVIQTFSAGTVTFSTNKLDLGGVPTGTVRFTVEDEEPGDTSVTYEVLADDGVTWVTFTSGQTTADLTGVGKRQTYAVRATLDPGSPANQSPAIISIGVEEVATTDLDGLAQVSVTGWQVDPVQSRGSICEATITALKDGRKDYADRATELVSENDPVDIAFKVYRGWKDSDGAVQGVHIDTFDVDDWAGEGPTLTFTCVGRNGRLSNVALPIYDTGAGEREPLSYENQTLEDVWDDILTNQVALDDRLIGPGVEDDTTQVTKTIKDSEALAELDAIARLAGGAAISSQGRIKFVQMHQDGGREVVHIFGRGDIVPGRIGPGLRARIPLYFVPWDYNFDTNEFGDEIRSVAANSVLANKAWRIDGPDRLDAETAKWIDTEALATTVANRVTNTMGSGLILWPFQSLFGMPHLEPGDVVAVPTNRFAAKDPNGTRALKGQLYAIGPIQRVGDAEGTDFVMWVQSYADIRSSSTAITRRGFASPEVLSVDPVDDGSGVITAVLNGNADTGGFRVATSTAAAPSLATIQAASVSAATDHVLTTGTLASLTPGQTLYIGAIAVENGSSPHGAEQAFAVRATYTRPQGAPPDVLLKSGTVAISGTNVVADVVVAVSDDAGASGTLSIWTNKASTSDPDPTLAADQQVTVASGETAGPSGVADVTATALDNIVVASITRPGARKEIFVEWVSTDGRSSGVKTFTLTRGLLTLSEVDTAVFGGTGGNTPKRVRAETGGFDVDPDDVFRSATGIKSSLVLNPVNAANRGGIQEVSGGGDLLTGTNGGGGFFDGSITVATHTLKLGGQTVSYTGDDITGLSPDNSFFVYADDPTFAGGAVAYGTTQDWADIVGAADGRYYVGQVHIPASTGSQGGETGGPTDPEALI